MKALLQRIPILSFLLLAVYLVLMAVRTNNDTTTEMIASSIVMFAFCWSSATHLMGAKAAMKFVAIAMVVGWFAEEMGASRGWFFGSYTYTAVLGPRLGEVPMIIPLMWFALAYVGYVLANLIVRRAPVDGSSKLSDAVWMSFLTGMIVCAYDLGADPYMVRVVKAWIMTETDGWWFGETVEGFFGWTFIAFAIVFLFRLSVRKAPPIPVTKFSRWHALLPLLVYGGSMIFQVLKGVPFETRSIAAFAMGIPILCALAGWQYWTEHDVTTAGETA